MRTPSTGIRVFLLMSALLTVAKIRNSFFHATDVNFVDNLGFDAPIVLKEPKIGISRRSKDENSGNGEKPENNPNAVVNKPIRSDSKLLPEQKHERIAIVMRGMDPLNKVVMDRLILMSSILERKEFQNYDLHVMLDQTKNNLTTPATIQQYFRDHNASHLKPPALFGVTEKMVRNEFPAMDDKNAKGYIPGPLVDGTTGQCCGKPLMWQFLMPTFIMFTHRHQEYDYTWVYEDDVWSVGKPIIEIFRLWDKRMKGQNASVAGVKIERAKAPYTKMMKERQTEGFRDILVAMKASHWQRRNETLLRINNLTRTTVWNSWDESTVPTWSCMTDSFYRHSREFSNYVYSMLRKNVFQFAECYQMPLAWYGGFNVSDLEKVLTGEEANYLAWAPFLFRKISYEQALERLDALENSTALIYHEEFFPKPK